MDKSINGRSGNAPEAVTLSRDLNLFTITMIGVGGMIGAGIFVLTGIAAGVAGPALVLAFFLNGLVTIFTAMAYAELGSVLPKAGGSYFWVKEGLGGSFGFLSGWMSWFASVVAGSLYGLGFGRFAAELWFIAGLPKFGLDVGQWTLAFMTMVIIVFTFINYRGTSETGTIGNFVTVTKILILALFVLFGIIAMLRTEAWHTRFTTGFMPNGILGVVTAMSLTFIAFEGYEIISQSGEEVIDPRRNIPRAIFMAIFIAVSIYIFVAITAIGAIKPPDGVQAYIYLGQQEEVAIVDVAQQTFPGGIGGIVLLFSGLVSTMSALNATMYSSSRVSFAMGRDHNLPVFFSKIHPQRHTPFWAILCSGGLMLLMAWTLPLQGVAAAADIMFLLLFLLVNLTVMVLRRKMPQATRGFTIPWFPVVPVVGLVINGLLAINLFHFSPLSWYTALIWVIGGMLVYYIYFSKAEALERPKEILMEEVLVSRDYSVVVPVANQEQARILGRIGAILARDNGGELLALHVLHIPPQLDLGEGRLLLKEGRPYLETVIGQGKALEVPVHTVLRLGRNVVEAVRKTVEENAADLLVLGWPGYTHTSGRIFGSVLDPIVDNPPADIAIVRYRAYRPLRSVLVPVGGGPNSRRAVRLAVSMARQSDGSPAGVTLLHIVPAGAPQASLIRAEQVLKDLTEGLDYQSVDTQIIEGTDVSEAILSFARGSTPETKYDLIVAGATNEPLFHNLLVGNIIEKIAQEADVTVIVVKRRSSRLHDFLRKTVLEPTTEQNNHIKSPPSPVI
jgi:amino acid transporter/nucleotide-binding universal stress UspA family protein